MLRILACMAPVTAASMSASSNTRNGAFPPSSIEVRSTFSAACCNNLTPTGVEPVKVILRRRGSAMIGPDVAEDVLVVITLITPAGRPASSKALTKNRVVSGVSSAGLTTMVQPAAIAGAILRVAIASGKFQGVIANAGPTGRLVISIFPVPSGFEPKRPPIRAASSPNQRTNSLP
ncbi:unannotated protein [freshwater metagenome]|uniref:Unannotated protein n=1 Tax=freshwater metagenome TaxID=449393 RepID=A0A6J6BLK0_9ZZZZ